MGLNIPLEVATKHQPQLVSRLAYIADNATVIGHVEIGDHTSIWYGSVIRGDSDKIVIGNNTNIQDLCVVHTDAGIECRIGDEVTVGHSAIIHGAEISSRVLIGMRAIVLNHAKIGPGSIVAPGAIVIEGTEVPPDSVVMGVPGKVVRTVNEKDRSRISNASQHYQTLANHYRVEHR